MRNSREEIIADIQEQIRKAGGHPHDWCVGTAEDPHNSLFESHRRTEIRDGLMYREAFTSSSAEAAREYLVSELSLQPEMSEEPEPGRFVFAYRKTASALSDPRPPAFHKLAV